MDLAAHSAPARGVLAIEHVEALPKASCGPTVLLVDDDEATCRTLAFLLRFSGFEAEFVLTGAEGLALALTAPPDAVILDVHLADDDIPGFLVLQSLRAKYPDLPVIAMTGWYLAPEHQAQARALGVTDYLFKPLDDSDLVARLHAALASPPNGQRRQSSPRSAGAATTSESPSHELAAAESTFIASRMRHLGRLMRRAFPTVWDDVIFEQIEDTLLEFLANVKRGTWPVRGSLKGHHRRAAWRNVRDQVRRATRRAAYESLYAREQPQLSRPDDVHSSVDLEALLILAQTAAERDALRRWAEDDSSRRIAEALGLSDLPADQQLREVKRFKDRIKKRARRNN